MPTTKVGQLVMESTYSPIYEHSITVVQADPKIAVGVQFLEQIAKGDQLFAEIDGDLLRIKASNGTWVYRIGEEMPFQHAYYAELQD
jgi:hypothetical protein